MKLEQPSDGTSDACRLYWSYVLCSAADVLFEEYKDKRYAPSPAFRRMVLLGFWDVKRKRIL